MLIRWVSAFQTQVRFSRALIGLVLGHALMFLLLFSFLLIPDHSDPPSGQSFFGEFSIIFLMSAVIFGWWLFGTNGLLMLTASFLISIAGIVFKRLNIISLIGCFVTAWVVDCYFGSSFKMIQGIKEIPRIPSFEGLDGVGEKLLISTMLFFIQMFPVFIMAIYIFFDPEYRKRNDL